MTLIRLKPLLSGLNHAIHEIISLNCLAIFYWRFIKDFSFIMAHITSCMKNNEFMWTMDAQKTFKIIKELMTQAPTLKLPNSAKVIEVSCDASK